MKNKYFFVFGVFISLLIGFGSCKKNSQNENAPTVNESKELLSTISTSSYTTPSVSKMLVFESVSEWDAKLDSLADLDDSIVAEWSDNISGFVSQRAFYSNPDDDDLNPNEDEDLANVLNNDGAVIIAGKAYMPDFTGGYIYICNVLNQTNINDMVNKNLPNLDVVRYPIHNEVLHMDEEGWDNELETESIQPVGTANPVKSRARCNDKHANGKKSKKMEEFCNGNFDVRIKSRAKYQSAGIRFTLSLKAKCQYERTIGWAKIKTDLSWKYTFKFTKKCQSEESANSSTWPNYTYDEVDGFKGVFYKGSRALTKYRLESYFFGVDDCKLPTQNIYVSPDVISIGY